MAAEFGALAEAFQDSLGLWLAGHAGIAAAFGTNPVRVVSAVDDRSVLPVLQTGEDGFRPALGARIVTPRVHVWTREAGMVLCKRIGGAVLDALTVTDEAGANNGFTVPGYRLVYGFSVLERYMRDPAENVRHGVLDFDMRFEPAA